MRSYLQFTIEKVTTSPIASIAASVGLAIPADSSMHGYLSEHHSFGETDEKAGEYAEDLAASMLATTVGIEFNPEMDWDEREQIFKMSGKIVRTTNITQSAVGNKDGLWTTVFAAAVFINDDNLSIDTAKSVTVAAQGSPQEEVLRQTLEGQHEKHRSSASKGTGETRHRAGQAPHVHKKKPLVNSFLRTISQSLLCVVDLHEARFLSSY